MSYVWEEYSIETSDASATDDKPNEPERKLPVMVFIHGGAFVGGKAGDYHPNVLMNKEIVLVIIQYRLGILDFYQLRIL
ncbi:Cocaine esterase [Armadillidium vulgare]|nr:Cocaine esterase [Armadillidium vulgare]